MYLVLLPGLSGLWAQNQGTTAWLDERGQLLAREMGQTHVLEIIGVQSWKCAPDYLTYVDNAGELIHFRNGKKKPLGVVRPEWYEAREGFLAYKVRDQISLYHEGTKHRLGFLSGEALAVGDSVVGFRDNTGALFAFYQGRFERLELFPVDSLRAGINVLHYVDQNGRFRAFWKGRAGTLDDLAPQKVAAGSDIIAWNDPFGRLKIFYRGKFSQPETGYQALELFAGRSFIAWLDDRGEFFVWYDGLTTRLLQEPPISYGVKDHLIWYVDRNGMFRAFYQGKVHLLESFAPPAVEAMGHVLAYAELDGRVRAFAYGEKKKVSDNIARQFGISGDLIYWSELPFQWAFLPVK
jgi:hypothetical protein